MVKMQTHEQGKTLLLMPPHPTLDQIFFPEAPNGGYLTREMGERNDSQLEIERGQQDTWRAAGGALRKGKGI